MIVDIISSNTHSVVNLVSPWLHRKKKEILEWGRKNRPDIVEVFYQSLLYNLKLLFLIKYLFICLFIYNYNNN